MSFLKTLFNRTEPKNELEKLVLGYDFFKQFIREYTGDHKRVIKESFLPEEQIAKFLTNFRHTPQSRLFEKYFKPTLYQGHNIPKDDGALLVANHSGMFGWDGLAIYQSVFRETGRVVSMMGHEIFENSDMRKMFGVLSREPKEAAKLLKGGRVALSCPGGAMEVAKPFWERYNVQRTGSFAEGKYGYLLIALEAEKPVIPVGVVGAEETHVVLGDAKPFLQDKVNRFYDRLNGKAKRYFKPLKEALNKTQAFPFPINLIPFKSKIDIWVGEPIHFHKDLYKVEQILISSYRDFRKKKDKNKDEKRFYETMETILSAMNDRTIEEIQKLIDHGLKIRKG
jgi:1-acyl-sn-glycerol-3-phosphate acyltransferase